MIRRTIYFQALDLYLHFDEVNRKASAGTLGKFSSPGPS
jgi:hypothetical protein